MAGLVADLVPESAGQVGGYIRVTSEEPIIGQQLFGTSVLSLLSAVLPRIIQ